MLHAVLPTLYFAVLLALSAYGLHRLHLVYLCARHRKVIEGAMHTPPSAGEGERRAQEAGRHGDPQRG